MNWMGKEIELKGFLTVNGKIYSFMGKNDEVPNLKQTNVDVSLFETRFYFEEDDFDFNVRFFSPLPITDLSILSNPSCYLIYEIVPKTKLVDVEVRFYINENIAYQNKGAMRGDVIKLDDYEVAYFGRDEQNILSHSADQTTADWGYYYLLGQDCGYISNGKNEQHLGDASYIYAINSYKEIKQKVEGKFIVAFDDVCSIFYFGELLRNYYFDNPEVTIFDALKDAYENYDKILQTCNELEERIISQAKEYGEDYKNILFSSYRQSVTSHKVVKDRKRRVLFLSKENGSDGCIATADITYPSMPLYLLYNPSLVLGMLYPIVDFARKDVWEFDFAPHDVGVYPYCIGQFYAIRNKNEGKYQRNITYLKEDNGVLPHYYVYPKGQNIYDFAKQMPIEECGNMLIASYLVCRELGDQNFLKENFDLLTKWANYLKESPLYPDNQLCTDDFAGPSKHNINLAIKAVVAIAVYAKIADLIGKKATEFDTLARERAKEIEANANLHLPLQKDDKERTFGLKYNLYADLICDTRLFSKTLYENEVSCYIEKELEFGCPLDSRKPYSKTDWQVWVSCLTDDLSKRKILYSKINRFITSTPDRYPFVDWYCCESGRASTYSADNRMFRNRSVQGGCFAPLYEKWRKK